MVATRIKSRWLPAVLAALLLVFSLPLISRADPAAPAGRNYADRVLGYSLTIPGHWVVQVKPGSGGRSLVFSGAKGTSEYASTISLQVITSGSYANMEQLAKELTAQWGRMPGYRLLSRQQGSLAGRPASRLVAEYQPSGGGAPYRQEQFICQGVRDWYLLAYTAPVRIYETYHHYMDRALTSFTLGGAPPAPGNGARAAAPPPSKAYKEKMLAATFGPAVLKQAGGPLYAPSYDNGTYQGRQVARAVASMVGTQSSVLRRLARRQAEVLSVYGRLGKVQAAQAALLEAELPALPAGVKRLFKLQAEYALLQAAQRGAVEGALAALPAPEAVSGDLAGVQALAALQTGLGDQQALILRQNQEVWSAGMRLYEDLGRESSGLPAYLRLRLAQFNRRQQETAVELIAAVDNMNGAMANLVMVLDLWGEFQQRVGAAYARDLGNALPGLRADAKRLRRADPNHPALAVIDNTIAALDRTRRNLAAQTRSAGGRGLWRLLADAAVPPAQAGAWDFTKLFLENTYYAGRIAVTATLNVPRLAAMGLGNSAERLGQELSYGSIKLLNVTSDPDDILPSADEIIKRHPELAGKRDQLAAALKKIKKQHKVNDVNGYLTLKKAAIDANVAEYRSKNYGARALTGAADFIDGLKEGVEKGAEGATQNLVRGIAGDFAGDTLGWAAGKVNGFVAGVTFGVVADIPRGVTVLINPTSSWADKGKASFDLVGAMGGAFSGMAKTGLAAGAKAFPKVTKLVEGGVSLVGRLIPGGSKAAGMADEVLGPLIKKAKDVGGAAVQKVRQMDLGIVKKAEEGIEKGISKVTGLVAKPLAKTGKEDLANIVGTVTKNLKAKDGEVLKNFAENFTNKGLLENAANGTISDKGLKPLLDALEGYFTAKPDKAKTGPGPKAASAEKAEDKDRSGFSSESAAGGEKAEAKKAREPKASPRPKTRPKQRAETKEQRKKREAELMNMAKRSAKQKQPVEQKEGRDESIPVIEQDCTIDTVIWHPANPSEKFRESYHIRDGQVSATMDMTTDFSKYGTATWGCAPQRTTGTFSGSLKDNVISGPWSLRTHPHTCWYTWEVSVKGADGKYKRDANGKYLKEKRRCEYTSEGRSTMHSELVLKMGHQLVLTYHGSQTSTTSWGAGCSPSVAGTSKTVSSNFSFDDPNVEDKYRKPMQGVWKKRLPSKAR